MRKVDITGKKYNHLTPIRRIGRVGHNTMWECKCDCGNTTTVSLANIRSGHTKSCGCIRAAKDLTGERFGRLTVVRFDHYSRTGQQYYECKCDCGNTKLVQASHLQSGNVSSCGCKNSTVTKMPFRHHGLYKTRIHNIWCGIFARCYNPNSPVYDRYGGRGIRVCDEWRDIVNFCDWAYKNGYSDNLTLDRIDNDGNYEPSNCRWADKYTQSNNRNNIVKYDYKGGKYTITELARMSGINYGTLRTRIKRYGYSIEEAMIPTKNRNSIIKKRTAI